MSEKYLHRNDAPFSASVWSQIDQTVLGAAKAQLTARRLLYVDGPFGLGYKAISGGETEGKPVGAVNMSVSSTKPLVMIRREFTLPTRDIAAFEQNGLPVDLGAAAMAASEAARLEDDIIFNGSKQAGVEGLLNAKGARSMQLGDWKQVGAAADSLIKAVTELDNAGFHGPYALALTPERYNQLFRRYTQGNATEMDHIRGFITDGIIKAPGLSSQGVLIASSRQFAGIVLGMDLATGFVGPAGGEYELFIAESVALRLTVPESVCVLK